MAISDLPKYKEQAEARERIRRRLDEKAAQFQAVFDTRNGQDVLRAVKAEFGLTELTANPNSTQIIVRAAQRDVTDYIERMVRHAERLSDAGEE
jgi:ribosome-associated translation inhibitor RaiA